jgi:spoIIIJ-associated protein
MNPHIRDIVATLVEKMGITSPELELVDSPVHPMARITCDSVDSKLLIGPHGEHLRALNTIARKLVERAAQADIHFLVDVNGYHQEHIVDIQTKAHMLAERVRTFKSATELAPMNAYERMIIHATFADDPTIETHSEGDGKDRRVVLRYREPAAPVENL